MIDILVVDDSLTVRMDLAGALEGAGFAVAQCTSLTEARAVLRERPIALAILDVRLPDGDGVDLLREIRSSPEHARLPVLMLSSEAEVQDRIRGLKTGANDYVGKPYDADLVIARVRQLVAAPDTGADTVLVIDDSPTFREGLASSLAAAGYQIATASSGTEGLRVAASRRPDAIIVDGVMPDMQGDLLIRRVRLDPALRTTPCLLLTGSDDAAAEIHALDAGADAFARKEADIDIILARFAAMLRSARDARPDDGAGADLLGSRRILAVDDSPTYLHALHEQLHEDGFDVAEATSGEQAIELLAVQPVDCILLDLMMPGLSGIETCRRIKAAPAVRDTPLIALTAHDDRDAMIEVLAAGADDFVSKASPADVLGARIKAQIRRKKLGEEYRRVRESLLRSEREAAEAHAARELAETRARLVEQLAHANQELHTANDALAAANNELESFSYSVSHDLRAPLRSIDGFSKMLLEDHAAALPTDAQGYLQRIRAAAQRMAELIDDLLDLSRVTRADLRRDRADLSAIARSIIDELQRREPERTVRAIIQSDIVASADPRLLRIALENLLGNAWKFSAKTAEPTIELGTRIENDELVYFVRDNGAGFDMKYAGRLFGAFQRLHTDKEFAGTGIGLATVQRIINRHRGRIWAMSEIGKGATFSFTIAPESKGRS